MTAIDINALMNMRGAGNAQKELIKAGKWRPFLTDTERMDWLEECAVTVREQESDEILFTTNPGFLRYSDIRHAIDTQALKEGTAT